MECGTYLAGKKHCLWELYHRDGSLSVRLPYDRGAPHGDATWFDHGKVTRTLRFEHGEVTQIDGRDVIDLLGRAYRTGTIEDPTVKKRVVDLYFGWYPSGDGLASTSGHPSILKDWPLKGVAPYVFQLRDRRVSIVLSKKCETAADQPASLGQEYMPAGAMLVVVLKPFGLVPTYRHGCIWITTKEDAQNWVDQSGVDDLLKSPPAGISQYALDRLRRNLDRPVTVQTIAVSAAGMADHLRKAEQLDVRWVGTTDGPAISSGFRELPLRHVLGAICDQHHLRVRWGENASLVLGPQHEANP
jgi:hypothetical protein